jgi:hypothetical protein
LEEGIHYYYCTVESSSNVVATSDLFTVTVTCSGAIVYNGAYNGPSAGTYNSSYSGSFSAGWTASVFTAQKKDLCWSATLIPDQYWVFAESACAALTAEGKSWRVPNLKELQFLYEALGGSGGSVSNFTALNTRGTGTANEAIAIANFQLSSTEYSRGSSGQAYNFNFNNGGRGIVNKGTSTRSVRCVRSLEPI